MKTKLSTIRGIGLATALLLSACSQQTPEERVISAEFYFNQGDPESATIELKNAIVENPNLAEARLLLGEIYVSTGDLPSAVKELERAVELGASIEKANPLLVRAHYHMEDWDTVVAMAETSQLEDIVGQSSVKLYGFIASSRDIDVENRENLETTLTLLTPEDAILATAYEHIVQNKFEDAIDTLSTYKSDNKGAVFHYIQGYAQLVRGDNSAAVTSFTASIADMPVLNSVTFFLGESLNRDGKFTEALAEATKILQTAPNNAAGNLMSARANLGLKNYEEAALAAEKAIQAGADTTTARATAGISSYMEQKYEKSYNHLNALLGRRALSQNLYKMLAQLQVRLGYLDEAKELLLQLENPTADDAGYLAQVGTQIALSGDVYGGSELLRRAVKAAPENADIRLGKAVIDMSSGSDDSVIEFESVIAADPTLEAGWVYLALNHMDNGDVDSALAVANEWKEKEPADGYTLEGMIYVRQDKHFEAESAYKKALQADPAHMGANIFLGKLLNSQGRFNDAMEQARQAITHHPVHSRFLMSLVRSAVDAGKHAEATNFMQTHLKDHPGETNVIVALGASLRMQGKVPEAIEFLQGQKSNLNGFGWLTLGDALLSSRKAEKALSAYAEWRKAIPSDPGGWLRAIGLYGAANADEEALQLAKEAALKFPEVTRFLQLSLIHQTKLGRLGEAKSSLEALRSSGVNPGNYAPSEAYYQLASADYAKAVELYERLYEADPKFNHMRGLAEALIRGNRPQEGVSIIDGFLDNNTLDNAINKFVVAELYSSANATKKAEGTYSSLIAENDSNTIWLNNLAGLQLKNGKLDDAAKTAEKAMSSLTENTKGFRPYVLDTKGWINYKQGNIESAFEQLYEAYQALPDNNEIKLHLLEVLLDQKHKVLADKIMGEINPSNSVEKETYDRLVKRSRG